MLGKKRVLIVDDEVTIADSLASILTSKGYEARAAYSPAAALDLISDWLPDLAIVDVQLRDRDGVAFAILLRKQFASCEVALFSGYSSTDEILEKARGAGYGFEVIFKPIHPQKMLAIVARKLQGEGEPELRLA